MQEEFTSPKWLNITHEPHTASAAPDTVWRLRFQILQQPPYSPDLTPSDHHV